MIYARIAVIVLWSSAMAASGAYITKWRTDSESLAVLQASEAIAKAQAARELSIAKSVLDAIKAEDFKERIIEKRIREVTEREIYKTECIDDDGLDIINGLYANMPDQGTGTAAGNSPAKMP